MRMRRNPLARPELSICDFFIDRPATMLGNWKKSFARPEKPLYIELGCGKGGFMCQIASQNKDINFLGFDIKSEVLFLAKRKVEASFEQENTAIDNVFLMSYDIERIDEVVDRTDEVTRIYINFCNPWPKSKHNKRRLTHTRQLEKYKTFLAEKGEIYFKTDDDDLFEASLEYFTESGFVLTYKSYDLHKDNMPWNLMTEHEKMFSDDGIKIKALIAKRI